MSAFSDKILLATDGSPESARAARMAAGLSSSLGSELHVIHVEPIPNIYAAPESGVMDPELQYKLRERAEIDARERLDEEIEKMGGEVSGVHARVGRPDAEIVALAGELGAGLIILGSRGGGPLEARSHGQRPQ
ncbi:MAG TPA: universal stress protein [Rubrobacteraceae bacterium]|nr:universal stress protein [Rubrobacteraceae bacterium]